MWWCIERRIEIGVVEKRDLETYYWQGKNEVDFVVKHRNNKLTAINVSYTNDISDRELKGLFEFKDNFKTKTKELVLITKDIEKKDNGVRFVPLWKWLLDNCAI